MKICVVDDCLDEASVLCDGLGLFGYESMAVHTGIEALECCRRGDVQLVLLDIGLPDLDGYEVCRQLKADPTTMDIPVIFVTARGSSEDVTRGYRLGAVDYIAKPYNLPIVIIHVDAALRTRQFSPEMLSSPYLLADPVYTDQLTGLKNRRFLIERLQEEAEKAHRYHYPVSCLMLDVDEYIPENSERENHSLDNVLVEVALALRNSSRTFDILARYDDTQFAAILPHISLPDAVCYARKIQHELKAASDSDPWFGNGAHLSFGIVSCHNGRRVPSAEELLGEAMRNLLRAKSGAAERIIARGFEVEV